MRTDDTDVVAEFHGEKWAVEWKWQKGELQLNSQCGQYLVPPEHAEGYEAEVSQWIKDGWLEQYDAAIHGHVD